MTRIPTIDPAVAHGKTQDLLAAVARTFGRVPNLFKVAAQSPAALDGLLALFGALQETALPASVRESVALAVAEHNTCGYCLAAHTALGRHAGLGSDEIIAARQGRARDRRAGAALALAVAIIDAKGHVADQDLAAARQVLEAGEVVEVVALVALNVFTNYLNSVAATAVDFPAVADAR
jgi:AhpD family alkylhydroperoxidase